MNKVKNIKKEIEKTKQKLIEKAKIKGLWENFGQEEVSKIKEVFKINHYGDDSDRECHKLLMEFNEWCMNYENKGY